VVLCTLQPISGAAEARDGAGMQLVSWRVWRAAGGSPRGDSLSDSVFCWSRGGSFSARRWPLAELFRFVECSGAVRAAAAAAVMLL
jgi:hypothetical protein